MNKLILIILSIIILSYYVNEYNIVEDIKDEIRIKIYNGLTIIFILLLVYYSLFYNFTQGLYSTFITWCMLIVSTPIPEAGLLISIPLKNLFNINLDITQWVVSFVSLLIIYFLYYNYNYTLKQSKAGMYALKIINLNMYPIFIYSILSSVSISYLINEFLDFYVYKSKIENIEIYGFISILSIILYIIQFRNII